LFEQPLDFVRVAVLSFNIWYPHLFWPSAFSAVLLLYNMMNEENFLSDFFCRFDWNWNDFILALCQIFSKYRAEDFNFSS